MRGRPATSLTVCNQRQIVTSEPPVPTQDIETAGSVPKLLTAARATRISAATAYSLIAYPQKTSTSGACAPPPLAILRTRLRHKKGPFGNGAVPVGKLHLTGRGRGPASPICISAPPTWFICDLTSTFTVEQSRVATVLAGWKCRADIADLCAVHLVAGQAHRDHSTVASNRRTGKRVPSSMISTRRPAFSTSWSQRADPLSKSTQIWLP